MRKFLHKRSATCKITALALVCAVILTAGILLLPLEEVFALGGSGSMGGSGSLGDSDALGFSGEVISISTAQELYAVSLRVNSGESFKNKMLSIQQDISLRELNVWEAVGTAEHPFTGWFEGNDKIISGLDADHPMFATLLGNIENATVRNVTLAARCADTLEDVSAYLFADAKTSTITGCKVVLDLYSPFTLFRASQYEPDIEWYQLNTAGPSFDIGTVNQLLGLAKLVYDGTDSFAGKTVRLTGDVDMTDFGPLWKPIGTATHPFEGTFTAAAPRTITGLQMDDRTVDSAGLFGHVKGATISNMKMVGASVAGSRNVGILVGHMTDSTVSDCSTTGKVSGATGIGGVIGYATHTTSSTTIATGCFSTADVGGTSMVGGFVGELDGQAQIDRCFATGNVSGVLEAGGFIGRFNGTSCGVTNVAATGNVQGSLSVGGIAGGGSNDITVYIEQAYTASRVSGSTGIGGIIGAQGSALNTYMSGFVTGPKNDGFIGAGSGSADLWNPNIADESLANWDTVVNRLTDDASGINHSSYTNPWFVDGTTKQEMDSTYFTANQLLFSGSTASANLVITGGNYPRLRVFDSMSSVFSDAFSDFSLVSTDALVVQMPARMIRNATTGALMAQGSSTPFTLPDPSGLSRPIRWRFSDGGTTWAIQDPTLSGAPNTITIDGSGRLYADQPLNTEQTIVLHGTVPGIEGLVIKRTILLVDEAARPLHASFPVALHSDTPAQIPDEQRLSTWETTLFVEYDEPLSASLVPFSDNCLSPCNSSWAVNGPAISVQFTPVSDTLLKLEILGALDFDTRYKLDMPALLKDVQGNRVQSPYYLMTLKNMVAKLSFSPHMPGQSFLSDSHEQQTIRLEAGDARYNPAGGYLEGILLENETAVPIDEAHVTVQFFADSSLFGTSAFPAQGGDTAPDKHNFYKYPGVYRFTYQIDDPEDGTPSNRITRTYEIRSSIRDLFLVDSVYGETHLDKYQPSIVLNAAAVGEILVDSTPATANANIVEALRLATVHKATAIGPGGQEELLAIDYDFTPVAGPLYKEGYNGVVLYGIDGQAPSRPLFVHIEPALSVLEIETDHIRYLVEEGGYDPDAAMRYFNPWLQHTDSTKRESIPADWSLSGAVDDSKTHDNQVVRIHATNIFGMPDLARHKDVVVSVVPEELKQEEWKNKPQHEYDTYFWERVEVWIRSAKPGDIVEAHVEYRYAYAPLSVFKALSQQEEVTLRLDLHNGVSVLIRSQDVDMAAIVSPSELFNVYIEPIESLDVTRDAAGEPVQMFYAKGYYHIPGGYTVQIPLREELQNRRELTLYAYDPAARTYRLLQRLDTEAITDGLLSVKLEAIEGEYVIS